MKILAVSNLYPPNVVGGYEQLCFDVMQGLAAKGHGVSILTSTYGGKRCEYTGQQIFRTLQLSANSDNLYEPYFASDEERAKTDRFNISEIQKVLELVDPDIVFVWNLHFFNTPVLETLELSEKKLVYLLTDNWLISFYQPDFIADYFTRKVYGSVSRGRRLFERLRSCPRCRLKYFSTLGKAIVKRTLLRGRNQQIFGAGNTSHKLGGSPIFPSSFMRDLYSRAGFRFEDTTIIHHGVTAPLVASVPRADRSQFVMDGELRLLFAGRVVEIKGAHTAIKALPQIIRACPRLDVHLTIVGDDRDQPYKQGLLRLVKSLGMKKQVSFANPVPESELFSLFQQHDIYLFPSLYEPFSLTLIHALQAGIPTVATNVGGNPEIVIPGKTGLLCPKSDSKVLAARVCEYAFNNAMRADIGLRGSAYASEFTFSRMISQVEDHLCSICSIGKKGS